MSSSSMMGSEKVKKLIFNLGWPAAVNFLVIAVYNITDVIFVGHWLGTMQIAAVVVVGTVHFLFSAFGLAIGIGGASVISRALGEKDKEKAMLVFGNQIILTLTFSFLIVIAGLFFENFILRQFGAYGRILGPAKEYYLVMLFGIPFLSLSMMGNNVIQAEGNPKVTMVNSLVPTVLNVILNPLFIKGFNLGIKGAAFSTLIAFIVGFIMTARFFLSNVSEIGFNRRYLKLSVSLAREILAIGASVMLNVVVTNLFVVLLNKSLYKYQDEAGVVVYSIISRINLLFLVPVIGIDGGIRPIIGYNFGSRQMERIRDTVYVAIKYGIAICYSLLVIIFACSDYLISLFTSDAHVISITLFAIRIVLSCFPMFVVEVVTVAYFQSIGNPRTAFFLTIFRNILLIVPLLHILPYFFGYNGILYTFPIVDITTTILAFYLIRTELNAKLFQRVNTSIQL